jgi:hypothetical protein
MSPPGNDPGREHEDDEEDKQGLQLDYTVLGRGGFNRGRFPLLNLMGPLPGLVLFFLVRLSLGKLGLD